jgi:hypothetical protein
LVVLVIWMVIVFGGELLQAGGTSSLDALVSEGVVYALVLAPIFLLTVVAYFKWWQPVGLKGPDSWRDLRLLWLPALALILIWMLAESTGLPEGQAFWFILINTLLVGISEELMFRGILFHGAASKFDWRRAVWITALVFGLIHALNGLITGEIGAAVFQALMAGLFGVWTVALRLRLNTIIPLMILHWLWDFGIFSLSAPGGVTTIFSIGLPILFAIILFLYGLWLLNGYRKSDSVTSSVS